MKKAKSRFTKSFKNPKQNVQKTTYRYGGNDNKKEITNITEEEAKHFLLSEPEIVGNIEAMRVQTGLSYRGLLFCMMKNYLSKKGMSFDNVNEIELDPPTGMILYVFQRITLVSHLFALHKDNK